MVLIRAASAGRFGGPLLSSEDGSIWKWETEMAVRKLAWFLSLQYLEALDYCTLQ